MVDIKLARRILTNLGAIEHRLRRGRYICMYPGCKSLAIGSHSQQDSGQLRHIAEEQHVVAFHRNLKAGWKGLAGLQGPEWSVGRMGMHNVSVFKGFCNKHDTDLFETIERKPLVQDDTEQVLALHRRAVAYELWNKQFVIDIRRRLINEEGCHVLPLIPAVEEDARLLAADRRYAWDPLWGANPVSEIEWKWRVVNKNIGVSLTSCIPPLDDLSFMAYMASYYDTARCTYEQARPFFSLSILPEPMCTHVVMCWNRCNSRNVEAWVDRFMTDNSLSDFLNECVFCKSEDYCLRPSLWDSLPVAEQNIIRKNLQSCGSLPVPNIIMI